MSGIYRSVLQTGTLFILTISSTAIIDRLIDINKSLRRIENQMKIQNNLNERTD
jgi:hypothetical protein